MALEVLGGGSLFLLIRGGRLRRRSIPALDSGIGFTMSNIERYKNDFEKLLKQGELVFEALSRYAYGDEYDQAILKAFKGDKKKQKTFLEAVPDFKSAYQPWYSEAIALLKQLLPDRLTDFIRLYEKPKGRKDLGFENYRIEDALQGLRVTRYGSEVVADTKSAIPHMKQQLAIVSSLKSRFESSLFDIRQLVQADLLDSELDAARELLKHKFLRAAGAVAGVVLERHLLEVCTIRGISITKKNPTISDLNDKLKEAAVIGTPEWRFNQHLGDIRNLCDHNKQQEPSVEQVNDLIAGVAKVTKTVF
jgi:hypothetical protein